MVADGGGRGRRRERTHGRHGSPAIAPGLGADSASSTCTSASNDATRLAYVEVLPDEKATSAIGFLGRAVAHFAADGIRVEQILTDGRPRLPLAPARARLQGAWDQAPAHETVPPSHERQRPSASSRPCRRLRVRGHLPHLGGAHASAPRLDRLYNHRRPHGSLGHQTPLARLHAVMNNVVGSHG
jgi:transposase InsO family protein